MLKINFKKLQIYIILMLFQMKNTLKNNLYYISKQTHTPHLLKNDLRDINSSYLIYSLLKNHSNLS